VPELRTADPEAPAARPLWAGLAEEYARAYGERIEGELSIREAADFRPPRGVLLLLTQGSDTIAGGALAPLAAGVAEVKRMWTSPRHRRRGHARVILAGLERHAAELGYRSLRLQTGERSRAAVELYRAAGYRRVPPFGRYEREPLAVAFEKRLRPAMTARMDA
jgi:ribosomal protein S18 acetylase RimI-like enzyme